MKKGVGVVSAVVLVVAFGAWGQAAPAPAGLPEAAKSLRLPVPRFEGGLAVEKTLQARRSQRAFSDQSLTLAEVGQLCWAAQGITDDKGHRTAPSAMATYPLELYVLATRVVGLPTGLYRYIPAQHELALLKPGLTSTDLANQAAKQEWIRKAPAVFVLTGVAERANRKKTSKGERFVWVEAGLAAENFFLQAVSLGLGGTYVGGFDDEGLKKFLALPAGEEPLAVLPVGRKP